jgi:hypothetical protein
MTDPNQVAVIVGEPNWAPLERAVPATELENFMYMGRAGEIELYKHRITRRYLNIGRNSQTFYQYLNGEYTEISQASALEYVRGWTVSERSMVILKGVNKAMLLGHVGKDSEIRSTKLDQQEKEFESWGLSEPAVRAGASAFIFSQWVLEPNM